MTEAMPISPSTTPRKRAPVTGVRKGVAAAGLLVAAAMLGLPAFAVAHQVLAVAEVIDRVLEEIGEVELHDRALDHGRGRRLNTTRGRTISVARYAPRYRSITRCMCRMLLSCRGFSRSPSNPRECMPAWARVMFS